MFKHIFPNAMGTLITGSILMIPGVIFSESTATTVAQLFPEGGGYAPFLYGRVVDMLHFPLFTWPEWMPLVGGDVFFSPVFNFADSYITVAVFYLLFFQWRYFK